MQLFAAMDPQAAQGALDSGHKNNIQNTSARHDAVAAATADGVKRAQESAQQVTLGRHLGVGCHLHMLDPSLHLPCCHKHARQWGHCCMRFCWLCKACLAAYLHGMARRLHGLQPQTWACRGAPHTAAVAPLRGSQAWWARPQALWAKLVPGSTTRGQQQLASQAVLWGRLQASPQVQPPLCLAQ